LYLPPIIHTISQTLQTHHAKAIIVGGSVRDHFLQLPIKDYDIEVYGLASIQLLEEILSQYGSVNLVGKSFGVLKFIHNHEEYDFAFPRTEQKVGQGHTGFEVISDGFLSYKSASTRRDFTINAMGYDISNKQFLDPYDGLKDIQVKQLRHIDDNSFIEDPLRVYRAIQFSARFGYTLAPKTVLLCQSMVNKGMLTELPKERIYTEWVKLLFKSPKPSLGFELMRELGVLRYFPELQALIGVPQSPKWHPEGDVWIHTMMCLDAMVTLLGNDKRLNLKLMFAILCHDLGKATTTTVNTEGNIQAIGHESAGIEPTKTLMYRLSDEHAFIESLLPLVQHHLAPSQFFAGEAKSAAIRRLATKVTISELILVAKADFLGRTTAEAKIGIYKAGDWLLEKAKNLSVEHKPLDPLIQGRDLIKLGFKPSPQFKILLDNIYAKQLEGMITDKDSALNYIQTTFVESNS
jgi:tRNA nucleotidyltransferase (CCA-adding enzyme)